MKCPRCGYRMFDIVHPEADAHGGPIIDHPDQGILINLKYFCNRCNKVFQYSQIIAKELLEEIK